MNEISENDFGEILKFVMVGVARFTVKFAVIVAVVKSGNVAAGGGEPIGLSRRGNLWLRRLLKRNKDSFSDATLMPLCATLWHSSEAP